MSSRPNDIVTYLTTALAAINATGTYTNDLSATGRVFVSQGIPTSAPVPSVQIAQGNIPTVDEGSTLTQFTFTPEYYIAGTVAGASNTPGARLTAANTLIADIFQAVMVDRTFGGLLEFCNIEFDVVEGEQYGRAGCAVVLATIRVEWQSTGLR